MIEPSCQSNLTRGIPSASRSGRHAHVFTVFSTKGGSGKTVIATNLAVCFARQGLRTLLVDLDLHSGDDALVLGLSPRWTVLDLVQSPGDLDAEKLAGFVTRHASGVDRLPAPTRPDEEELVAIDRLEPLLEVARRSYDAVVIDTSSSFSPGTLLAIDHTDTLILAPVFAFPAPTRSRVIMGEEYSDFAWCERDEATGRLLFAGQRWAVRHIDDVIAPGGPEADFYRIR